MSSAKSRIAVASLLISALGVVGVGQQAYAQPLGLKTNEPGADATQGARAPNAPVQSYQGQIQGSQHLRPRWSKASQRVLDLHRTQCQRR